MRTHEEDYDHDYERHGGYSLGDDDETIEGWCECCGQACHGITVDNGIGSYEYWGSKGTHHQYDIESSCCNATVLDHDPNPEEEDCDVSAS